MHPTTGLCTRLLGFSPDYWAFHPTTGLFTRLLCFSPDCCTSHPKTGLFTRRLGCSPEDWALHPTTGLCTRRLGFAPDYCAFYPTTGLCTPLLGFHLNVEFLTQIQKGSHSTDQRTFIGHFPLNPGPLLMAYSHIYIERYGRYTSEVQ